MKTIRIISCITAVIVVCSLAGCGFIGEQKYTCDVENVKLIQIVLLGDYNKDTLLFSQTVLCEVEERDAFIEQLLSIKQSVNWGDPGTFHTGDIAIYIEYVNGDFDRISTTAQSKIRNGKGTGGGYIFFDKEQFNALLNDYLPESEQVGTNA